MFKLSKCKFYTLKGIEQLDLSICKITTFTGPNGTGKSTVLRVLELALKIIELNEVCSELPSENLWHIFDSAELTFVRENTVKTEFFGEINSITLSIECDGSTYYISKLSTGVNSVSFSRPLLNSELKDLYKQKGLVNIELGKLDELPPYNAGGFKELETAVSKREEEIKELNRKKILERIMEINIGISKGEKIKSSFDNGRELNNGETSRFEINNFLAGLELPTARLITTDHLMEQDIPALISRLVAMKIGKKSQVKAFQEREKRLNELLRSEAYFSMEEDKPSLVINGIPYDKASTGTYLALAFFAITDSEHTNKIILWDEPENGLHPTRRTQLLELMGRDPRQFVLATHATEFAPVLQSDGKVYRCVSDYDEENSHFQFSVVEVACRREAFKTLEALGISPARTLFTANVVIWVEGPTELLFYRHWLAKRLEPKGYQEGLHYTFMQYGGSLINYLEAADDGEFESTIDLLSHCRHPIVLVDSDLAEPVPQGESVESHLKDGAQRLSKQITELNETRKGAAMFLATAGREIENYLPAEAIIHAMEDQWKEFSKLKETLDLSKLRFDPYQNYFKSIEEFLKEGGQVDKKGEANGRSKWGAGNKVSMMKAALSMKNFDESKLLLDCASDLQRIEEFICSKHKVDYPTTLKS